jgi:hypothetical protein
VSFKITITETKEIETLTNREWVQGGPDGKEKDGTWGYSRQVPVKRQATTTVLEMVLEHIDLQRVVTAAMGSVEK